LEVVFGTKDRELTEELSARLGYDTVQGSSRTGPRFYRMFQRQSETNSDQRRALLLPQEIAGLDDSEAILIRPGLFPIRCRRIQYFNDATFAKLELRPPDIEPITIDIRLDRGIEKQVVKPQAPAPGTPARAGIKADVEDGETGEERSDPTPPSVRRRRTTPKAKSAKSKAKGKAKDKDAATDADSEQGGNVVALRPGTSHPADVPSPPQQEDLFPLMTAEQADALMVKIAGVVPSFQGLGMQDSKALIANMISRIPTVETLSGRGSEHESSVIDHQLRLEC
jgi:type IV secretion system protein VirD4